MAELGRRRRVWALVSGRRGSVGRNAYVGGETVVCCVHVGEGGA